MAMNQDACLGVMISHQNLYLVPKHQEQVSLSWEGSGSLDQIMNIMQY